jgi:hypothetical protein
MSSATITTIVKMVESLPDALQERVAEHIRDGDAILSRVIEISVDTVQTSQN